MGFRAPKFTLLRPWSRGLFASTIAAFLALTSAPACVVRETSQDQVVDRDPPPDRDEPPSASPGAEHAWIRGHWRWAHGEYVWVPGHWDRRPRPGAEWTHGHWARRGGGWVWVEGHWT